MEENYLYEPLLNDDPIKAIRKLEDLLSEITGLCFDYISPFGEEIIPSDYSPICQRVHSCTEGRRACERSTRDAIDTCVSKNQVVIVTCHIGLVDAYVPLIAGGKLLGLLACGQFLFEKPSVEKLKKIKKNLHRIDVFIGERELSTFNIPVYPKDKFLAVTKLMSSFSTFLSAAEKRMIELELQNSKNPYDKALLYVSNNYHRKISLNEVAETVNISISHLSHLFKKKAGKNFTEVLNELRIEKAGNLLCNTNMHTSEIAYEVGFSTVSHFNHTFKNITGMSPSVYKKQNNTNS
jgi:AraC-like DNA-binding protein/ligand-binding sensor protein